VAAVNRAATVKRKQANKKKAGVSPRLTL